MTKKGDAMFAMLQNEQLENLVVGRLICEPSILDHTPLTDSLFNIPRSKTVFQAIRSIREHLRDKDDLHNIHQIAAELEKESKLDCIGGLVALTEYYPAIGETFYNNVKELDTLRRNRLIAFAIQDADRSIRSGMHEGEEIADTLIKTLSSIMERPPENGNMKENVKEEVGRIFDFIEACKNGERPMIGIPTGIEVLDRQIGGIPIGVPTVIAARPGEGKSTLALNIANNVALSNIGVHLFSYEDGPRSFSQRMIALRSDNDLSRIVQRKLNDDDLLKIRSMKVAALDRIKVENAHGLTTEHIARSFRANKKEMNTRLVIIDYLQLMPGYDKHSATHEHLSRNMCDLATLAAQEDIALIVLSQLKRETQGVEPKLNDLRGSGTIEQVGKLIIALHSESPESEELKCIILKNFQGRRGYVKAQYLRATCTIK